MKNINFVRPAIVVLILLLIPITLNLTIGTGVDGQGFIWEFGDFVIMGALLFVVGLAIEFAIKKSNSSFNRAIIIVAIVLVFLLVWAELAVGLIGSPFAGS
jgi:hypothetical protein